MSAFQPLLAAAHQLVSELEGPEHPAPAAGVLQWQQPLSLPEHADLAAWLAAQPGDQKLYWRARDGSREIAALGWQQRWQDQAAQAALPQLTANPAALGFWLSGFDPASRWQPWPATLLLQPALALVREAGRCRLQLSATLAQLPQRRAELRRLHAGVLAAAPLPAVERSDDPPFEQWRQGVQRAVAEINRAALLKVVLARRTRLSAADAVPLWGVFLRWRQLNQQCYQLLLQEGEHGFVSLSPERLFLREGRALYSEALAGTFWHSQTVPPLGCIDAKLSHEHALVVEQLRRKLGECCRELHSDPAAGLYPQPNMQHLYCGFSGTLQTGVDDAELLERLHPTAAVCGLPTAPAAAFLQRHEPFGRGYYAGCFGPLSQTRSELAVGIRSARVAANRVDLYAGAGIVAASDPALEWQELDRKIALPLSLFAAADGAALARQPHVPPIASQS